MSPFITDRLKQSIPWFVKIPAKILLSRLPIGPRSWQHLNVFRAGGMDSPQYAWDIFKKHLDACGLAYLHGRTVLELGPGNSILTALYSHSLGAEHTWLVDGEELASQDVAVLARAEQLLAELKLPVTGAGKAESVNAALKLLNGEYLTHGLASLEKIPAAQVGFLFSNAVLEHIRRAEFVDLLRETRRVLKPDGISSHVIDFRDHLQTALNNLRFSERVWESNFMARSGFYTNRLTWPAMESIFQEAGFSVELHLHQQWPQGLPTPQKKMAPPFKNMPASELMTMLVHAVLRPK